jgi:hypothetical protein
MTRTRSEEEKPRRNGPTLSSRWVIVAAALAFVVKISLAWNTYGTNDVIFWERDLAKIQHDGGLALYRDGAQIYWNGAWVRTEPFNQPPFLIHLLRGWGAMADASGLPMRFWLRLTSVLADIGSLALVWSISKASKLYIHPLALGLVALSPVSIMVAGFHGNTDPLMVSLLLLSVYLIETGRGEWLAGAAFGMAMNIKIVPMIFAPVLLLYLPTMRRRAGFVVAAGGIFVAASLPYLAQEPLLIIHRVFGYGSGVGRWGIPRLIHLYLPQAAFAAYVAAGKLFALSTVLAASVWIYCGNRKPALFLQCGFVAFLFLFVTSGFGVQYLAWLVPWCAALAPRQTWFFYFASAVYVLALYTLWSWGFPWYLANALDTTFSPAQKGFVFLLETICWISVGFTACVFYRKLRSLKTVQLYKS